MLDSNWLTVDGLTLNINNIEAVTVNDTVSSYSYVYMTSGKQFAVRMPAIAFLELLENALNDQDESYSQYITQNFAELNADLPIQVDPVTKAVATAPVVLPTEDASIGQVAKLEVEAAQDVVEDAVGNTARVARKTATRKQ